MDRRQLLAGGAAVASFLPAAQALRAQDAAQIEEAKMAALEGGMFLMQTSQIAQERGQSDNVKAFAALEVAEQEAIARAFGAEGAQVPLSESHAQILEQLQAAEGEAFDMAYLEAQIAGHEEARPIHEQYAEGGEDPMARGASMVGVTGIDSHLVMLRSFQQQMGG
jgi:putative membrane protein